MKRARQKSSGAASLSCVPRETTGGKLLRRLSLAAVLVCSVSVGGTARAEPLLSQAERDWYVARLQANASGRFTSPVLTPVLAKAASDREGDALVDWDRLRRAAYPASFGELSGFLRKHRGWPLELEFRQRAERAISPNVSAAERLEFFEKFPPVTPQGHLALADASLATGEREQAVAHAREAWLSDGLTTEQEGWLLNRFGQALTPADHAARADLLLWKGQTAAATRLLTLLPPDQQPLVLARLALKSNAPDAAQRLADVPPAQRSDPGLLLDQANWMRRNINTVGARRLIADTNIQPGSATDPVTWMRERIDLARGAARDDQFELAYRLAARHNSYPLGRALSERPFADRDAYTDIEWLAGWTALKSLRDPARAIKHFLNYETAAQSPITRSRGAYWAGRAAEAAGRVEDARAYYARAGEHPDYFYGQLALERLGLPIRLPEAQPVRLSDADRRRFYDEEMVRATRVLGELGDSGRQNMFLKALVDGADTPERRALVADLARQINRPDLGVLIGKAAHRNGERTLVSAAYPQLPLSRLLQSAWTMIHAITRQESQFNRRAVSHANAQGLMQLMPGTAQQTAAKMGLPYDFGRLTRDPEYNVQLGSTYFSNMLDRWNGSYVLAVASYNAGPGNVSRWVAENGDPRSPNTDVIDWIERIPFAETRGYVQRVLENAVVYDLLRGNGGQPRPAQLSTYLGKSTPG